PLRAPQGNRLVRTTKNREGELCRGEKRRIHPQPEFTVPYFSQTPNPGVHGPETSRRLVPSLRSDDLSPGGASTAERRMRRLNPRQRGEEHCEREPCEHARARLIPSIRPVQRQTMRLRWRGTRHYRHQEVTRRPR